MSAPGSHRRAPYQRCTALLVVLLLGAIIATRALDATAFVTWDEPAWTYRSARFLVALTRGDLRGTALTGHPGVTTTWLGALGLAWHAGVARTIDWSQILAVDALATLDVHDAATMRLLGALLPAAKSALPYYAAIVGIYGLLRRLAGGPVSRCGVLAADPYYLALSRVAHRCPHRRAMLVALLAALRAWAWGKAARQRHPPPLWRRRLAVLARRTARGAVCCRAGDRHLWPAAPRARATRPPPRAGGGGSSGGARRRPMGWDDVGAFVAAWPAMWVPSRARGVLGLSLEYATAPGDATSFPGRTDRRPRGRLLPRGALLPRDAARARRPRPRPR